MKSTKRFRAFLISILAIVLPFVFQNDASAKTSSTLNLSQGVKVVSVKDTVANKKMSIHVMDINLRDSYTTVELGQPNPITRLTTTSQLAKLHTYENHHVVGAMNGSFFHFDTKLPAYLVSKDNKIINLGAVSNKSNDFMYVPAAFGMLSNGSGKIDRFNPTITIGYNGNVFTIDDYNKAREDNRSVLYTSSFHDTYTKTNPYGLEVVVTTNKPIENSNLSFGESVTGKVTAIRPYGAKSSSAIPKNGYVLSANGIAVDKIRGLKVGDEISLRIDIDNGWQNADFMLAGGPLLVQQGKVNMTIDKNSPRATTRGPHSAVAVDKTGSRVFFVTVDGRQPGVSEGMTLSEFASYLVSIGAYQALNLDGGGSTTMVARQKGNAYPTLINKPSDGGQRAVSTILEAVSLAPNGEAQMITASQAIKGYLAVGASVNIVINSAIDHFYNQLTVDPSKIQLKVGGDIGRVEGNTFIAEKTGTGYVDVYYGNASTRVPITVVDRVNSLTVEPKSIYLGTNHSQKLSVKALDEAGNPVIINGANVKWSVPSELGSIDEKGVFTAGKTETTGTIQASYGDKTISIPVTISNQPIVLENFDSLTNWKTDQIRATTAMSQANEKMIHEGKGAIKLSYNFTSSQKGTTASYLVAKKPLQMNGQPKAIGIWVNGDGNNHWLRGRLLDGNGKEVTIDFTEESGLNWYGWKYVEAKIPENLVLPIKFERIYIAETNENKQGKGAIYFDKLQAVYSDDYHEPSFNINPKDHHDKVVKTKTWKVKFSTKLDAKSVTNKTIYVEDEYGTRQNITVSLASDRKTVHVTAPKNDYVEGKTYRLVITTGVKSIVGTPMSGDYKKIFEIQ